MTSRILITINSIIIITNINIAILHTLTVLTTVVFVTNTVIIIARSIRHHASRCSFSVVSRLFC